MAGRTGGEETGEPGFGFGAEAPGLAMPGKADRAGMEGLMGKDETRALLRLQAILDQGQVEVLVTTIKLVADDRMADVSQVDSDLVFASCLRHDSQERKHSPRALELPHPPILGPGWRAIGPDAILDRHPALLVLAQRRVDGGMLLE